MGTSGEKKEIQYFKKKSSKKEIKVAKWRKTMLKKTRASYHPKQKIRKRKRSGVSRFF